MESYLSIDPNLWGDCASVVMVILTGLSCYLTYRLFTAANRISQYIALQNDRKIVEDICLLYVDARKSYSATLKHSDIKLLFSFWDAYRRAELYGLDEIAQLIKGDIDIINDMRQVYNKQYDHNGMPLPTHNIEGLDKLHSLEEEFLIKRGSLDIFKKYLKIYQLELK